MDDVPLCIDCGRNPQRFPRHDGEPGTHHRCDPCAGVFLRRRDLRRRLLNREWTYAAELEPVQCSECAAHVKPGDLFFRLGAAARAREGVRAVVCFDCSHDSGWAADIAQISAAPQLLRSAIVARRPSDCACCLVVRIPPAMPVLACKALEIVRPLDAARAVQARVEVSGGVMGELAVIVSGGSYGEAAPIVTACAVWLTQFAARVTVPPKMYGSVREAVREIHGIEHARRLARARRRKRTREDP